MGPDINGSTHQFMTNDEVLEVWDTVDPSNKVEYRCHDKPDTKLPNSTKIIFLDWDGVGYSADRDGPTRFYHYDHSCIEALNHLNNIPDLKVVLSSTTRDCVFKRRWAMEVFKEISGLELEIFDKTGSHCASRSDEIYEWIEANMEDPSNYRHYLIIDDEVSFDDYHVYEHYLYINPLDGITEADSDKAIAFFERGGMSSDIRFNKPFKNKEKHFSRISEHSLGNNDYKPED